MTASLVIAAVERAAVKMSRGEATADDAELVVAVVVVVVAAFVVAVADAAAAAARAAAVALCASSSAASSRTNVCGKTPTTPRTAPFHQPDAALEKTEMMSPTCWV
jgi:hypothetical protein